MFILEGKNRKHIKSTSHNLRSAIHLHESFGRRVVTFLWAVTICCGTAFAQQKEPARMLFFQGKALPTPPQQTATWSHGDDAFSKAAATLFEQGLADPRGLEYREIEIAVGNPWNGGGDPVKTHGWVLPQYGKDDRFAVAWNGLVYPVVRVGNVADLHKDWAPDTKMPLNEYRGDGSTSESLSVGYASPTPLKIVLLLHLGEVEIVNRLLKLTNLEINTDPYLSLANDWVWFAFERAVCAHARGDDRLALADARMLAKVQPLIEAEAKRRGFKPNPDYSNSRFPDRKLPYLPFLQQLPSLLADCERRMANPQTTSGKGDITSLIDDLQNVDARQWGQPGGVSLSTDPRVQALVKCGDTVVVPLLDAMQNDTRLTRSVSFGRDFGRSRNLISVSEAAYAALEDLLRVQFKAYDANGELLSLKEFVAQIRAYWVKMRDLSPMERFYATLQDDKAGKDQWLQAAANIVQPTDVEIHGDWATVPHRKPGEKVHLRGESLRDKRSPSVAQLLAQRSDDIAAIRTGSTQDHFLYIDAGQMALYLAEWDKTVAIPTLQKRLRRAWSIGAEKDDILAFNGNPAEHFGAIIAKMTVARAHCGDELAYDEYAVWVKKAQLKDVWFSSRELLTPLVQGAARLSIRQATEYLFNDPKSPWSDVFAPNNGFHVVEFWETPLPKTQGFRKQALRALADKTEAGTFTIRSYKAGNNSMDVQIVLKSVSMSFLTPYDASDKPLLGEKRTFRVCDLYAYFFSHYQNGPKFQPFWSEEKRDAGLLVYRKWLETQE